MKVLRENKDSLMAVLEAFVYDPLLNWRLIDGIIAFIILLFDFTHKNEIFYPAIVS